MAFGEMPREWPDVRRHPAAWISVGLHVAAIGALLLAGFLKADDRPDQPKVLTLMAQPAAKPADASPPKRNAEQLPDLKLPEPPELPPLPERSQPRAREPRPKPERNEPSPSRAEPERRQPKLTTAEDFFREHGRPEAPRPSQRRPERSVEAPEIRTDRVRERLERFLSEERVDDVARNASAETQKALQRYVARVRQRLKRSWRKPAALAGRELSATVVFAISPSGRVSDVRLDPPSGNAAFDDSIRRAFEAIGSFGPAPAGEGFTMRLDFRMEGA